MTSRRTEKTKLDEDNKSSRDSPQNSFAPKMAPLGTLNVTKPPVPRVSKTVVSKLLAYTTAMIVAPLSAYYFSLNNIYGGNNTFAGATAAVVANMVLIAYVIEALREDDADNEESKKNR